MHWRVKLVAALFLVLTMPYLTLTPVHAIYNNNPPPQPGFTHALLKPDDVQAGLQLQAGLVVWSSPVFADINNDGSKEVIISTTDQTNTTQHTLQAKLLAYKTDGTLLWQVSLDAPSLSSPAVGDLFRNGTEYVVVGIGDVDISNMNHNGGVIAVNGATGQVVWRFFTGDDFNAAKDGYTDSIISTPAIGDVNNDGRMEIAFGSFDRRIYLLDANGKMLWNYFEADTIWSSPVLADMDNDGFLEVIIGADISANAVLGTPNGGYTIAFDYKGNVKWKTFVDQVVYSSPAVGDLNGDGNLEIAVGSGDFFSGTGKHVTELDRTGHIIQQLATPGYVRSSPALADVKGNGRLDIIVATEESSPNQRDGRVIAWDPNGTQLWSVIPKDPFGNTFSLTASPAVADIDFDGKLEVLIGVGWVVDALDALTGQQITDNGQPPNNPSAWTMWASWSVLDTPAVGDIDNDGSLEVAVAGGHRYDGLHGYLYVWKIAPVNNPKPANLPWPMFHQNPSRTGLYLKPLSYDSIILGRSFPVAVKPGQSFTSTLTLQNVGTSTWTLGTFTLGAVGDSDPFIVGNRIGLSNSVSPGATVTFQIPMKAPAAEGVYATDWRMVSDSLSLWFGRTSNQTVKVGSNPAMYVLRGDGNIFNLGTANPLSPTQTWTWDAARVLALNSRDNGGWVYDLYGVGHNVSQAQFIAINQYSKPGLTKEVIQRDSFYWLLDGHGTISIMGASALGPPLPTYSGDVARSFALTNDYKGAYILLQDGTIAIAGNAPTLTPSTPVVSGDWARRIKLTPDGRGYYVLSMTGQIYTGGQAPSLPQSTPIWPGQDWAVDFAVTQDGQGYYVLTKDGMVYAGGTAAPITINEPVPWTVNPSIGVVARDLVLTDSSVISGDTYQKQVPGATPSSPAATSFNSQLYLVVRGMDNRIYVNKMDLATRVWSGYTIISGSTPDAPSVAATANSLYLIARGNDDGIYWRKLDKLGTWSNWIKLPGATSSSPALAIFNGRLYLSARGRNTASIYISSMDLGSEQWSGWVLLDGKTLTAPTLTVSADHLYVIVKGHDNAIYYRTMGLSGTWSSWTRVTGSVSAAPSAIIYGGQLYLVITNSNNQTFANIMDLKTTSWTGWYMIAGKTPDAPELVVAQSDIFLFVRGIGNGIGYRELW
jgi:hypothetical protein